MPTPTALTSIMRVVHTAAPSKSTLLIVITTSLAALSVPAYNNYQEWLALGPGAVPRNLFGWFAQGLFILLTSSDMTSTAVYDDVRERQKYGDAALKSHLKDELLVREGERPRIPRFVAPQRQVLGQVGMVASDKMQEHQARLLKSIVHTNTNTLRIAESRLERRGEAISLADEYTTHAPQGTQLLGGEVAHFHLKVTDVKGWTGKADGSGHCMLTLVDAKQVVAKGWGQRHRLSGVVMPLGYTMLYAPRSEEELGVIEKIVMASVDYMSGK